MHVRSSVTTILPLFKRLSVDRLHGHGLVEGGGRQVGEDRHPGHVAWKKKQKIFETSLKTSL